MNGMEMMLSRLIGLKPEEMKAQVAQAAEFMETGAKAMKQIQTDIAAIKKALGITDDMPAQELIPHVNGTDASRSNGNAPNRIEL